MELIYLYFLPVTMVVAWMVVYVATGRYRQLHDRIFMAFLAAGGLTLFISQQVVQNGACDYPFIVYNGLELLFELSVCPLLFIYIRSVAKEVRWRNWYLWLFAPAVVSCATYFVLAAAVDWDRIIEVSSDFYSVIVVLMEVVLMALSINVLVGYQRSSENFFANLEDSSADKMRNVLASVIVLLLSMILFTWIFSKLNDAKSEFLVLRALWFSVVLWMIASNAHKIVLTEKHLDVLEFNNQETEDAETEADSADGLTDDAELVRKIASWQEQADKPYCREGLTLKDLATQIGADPKAISAYFKDASSESSQRKNFNYWINTLRIEEAKRLLRTNPDYKISQISALCGYPTHSTFTRAFRQAEGQSPQEWVKVTVRARICSEP